MLTDFMHGKSSPVIRHSALIQATWILLTAWTQWTFTFFKNAHTYVLILHSAHTQAHTI